MKWISVKDRLPNQWQNVLVYRKRYGAHTGRIMNKDNPLSWSIAGVSGGGEKLMKERKPTHWMPLPDPPNEQ